VSIFKLNLRRLVTVRGQEERFRGHTVSSMSETGATPVLRQRSGLAVLCGLGDLGVRFQLNTCPLIRAESLIDCHDGGRALVACRIVGESLQRVGSLGNFTRVPVE